VPLKHRNLAASVQHIVATYALSPADVSLCVMPLFHVHGLVASALSTLGSGGTVVAPPRFNPLGFWSLVQSQRATWYSAVPTIHQLALARTTAGERPAGAETLRFIRSCSSALSPAIMLQLEERVGAPVLEAYGMTEASHQIASNPLPPAARLPGSVGVGTGVQVGAMDEQGTLLPAGVQGEVVILGPNVTDGYENNPEANATSFTAGWFRTGDLGVLDGAGYVTLQGRIKELINRGGEKISPLEVDEVLLLHPAVAEAVCFGVPHSAWGEEVAAAVVLRGEATAADIQRHCREHVAEFKVPKTVHVVEAIPRTATGKIQRRHVAAAFAKE
jgi:acyl-CoA synthetase (AMP-forming)/AMP-acid ligase II